MSERTRTSWSTSPRRFYPSVRLSSSRTAVIPLNRFGWLSPRRQEASSSLEWAGVERVGVLDTNSDRYIQLFYATSFLGGTFVPLNYRVRLRELEYLLSSAQVNTLRVGPQYHELATSARKSVPSLKKLVALGGPFEDMILFDDLLIDGTGSEPAEVNDEDIDVIMFTSGTAARPKGVMLRYRDLSSYVLDSAEPATEDDRYAQLLVAPLYHIAGLSAIMVAPYSGRRMVVHRQFEPVRWLETVQRERIAHAILVPTMVKRLIDEPTFGHCNLSSLEVLSYGAAPMPPGVLLRAIESFPKTVSFVNACGQTETAGTVTALGPEDHQLDGTPEEIERKKARLRSISKPVPGVELRIVNERRETLPPGEICEIAIRTSRAMKGYLQREGVMVDAARQDKDGWIYTADLGCMDEDGYVFLAGRKSDMIIRGGENISPEEVEAVLFRHPAVEDVAVIGVPDEEWGEQVVAVVVPRGEMRGVVNPEELITFCRERLASYKKSTRIEFVEELPRSPLGKVLRAVLRERFGGTYST